MSRSNPTERHALLGSLSTGSSPTYRLSPGESDQSQLATAEPTGELVNKQHRGIPSWYLKTVTPVIRPEIKEMLW